jgi:hypothetical protein
MFWCNDKNRNHTKHENHAMHLSKHMAKICLWLALLLGIQEILGSNLGSEIGDPD